MELSLRERDRMAVMRQASEGVLAVSEAAARRCTGCGAAGRIGRMRRRCASGLWRWRRSRSTWEHAVSKSMEAIFPFSTRNRSEGLMLTRLTPDNQITLPKAVTGELGDAEYVEVTVENGRIVLTPVQVVRAAAVRAKLAAMGITEDDVNDAVEWARSSVARDDA